VISRPPRSGSIISSSITSVGSGSSIASVGGGGGGSVGSGVSAAGDAHAANKTAIKSNAVNTKYSFFIFTFLLLDKKSSKLNYEIHLRKRKGLFFTSFRL
jgi:hypothetical protein